MSASRVKQPTKTLQMLSEVWSEVSANFGDHNDPDGHCNLVMVERWDTQHGSGPQEGP